LERAGKFPKRVPIGAARYGYIEAEIDAYIAALIAARDAGPPVGETNNMPPADGGKPPTDGETNNKPNTAKRREMRNAADRP
jgi:hypothetical protein